MSMTALPRLEAADVTYVRAHFLPLGLLAAAHGWNADMLRRAIDDGSIPQPTYTLPDGTAMVPIDYFALIGDGNDLASLRARFVARWEATLARLGLTAAPGDAEEEWAGYLGGGYGGCLKSVTPEMIALKRALTTAIESLLAEPDDADAAWCAALRDAVARYDAFAMPFAAWDRIRFGGPVTRDRLVYDVRRRFPGAFTV